MVPMSNRSMSKYFSSLSFTCNRASFGFPLGNAITIALAPLRIGNS